MEEHMNTSLSGQVQCELCLDQFSDADALISHKIDCHAHDMKAYVDRVYEWAQNKRNKNISWPFDS